MKNLIYQCWTGNTPRGAFISQNLMREYAKRIGAEYRFDHNPNIASRKCSVKYYYEKLNFMFDDSFLDYDKVLIVDMDVYPIDGLNENIFDVDVGELGICDEPYQPMYRKNGGVGGINGKADERWAHILKTRFDISLPRNEEGLLKVYNTGVLVYTKEAMIKARERFLPFQKYIDLCNREGLDYFYSIDQNYIHAMLEIAEMNYKEMDSGWNSYIHYVGDRNQNPRPVNDTRTKDTKFVHIQLRGADDFDGDKLWRITNLPEKDWKLYD